MGGRRMLGVLLVAEVAHLVQLAMRERLGARDAVVDLLAHRLVVLGVVAVLVDDRVAAVLVLPLGDRFLAVACPAVLVGLGVVRLRGGSGARAGGGDGKHDAGQGFHGGFLGSGREREARAVARSLGEGASRAAQARPLARTRQDRKRASESPYPASSG